jgi:hypothetical protein
MFHQGYALLIGVDENTLPTLALPIVKKDVVRMADVLTHADRCGYRDEHVRVLTGANATRENILTGLDWLKTQLAAEKDPNQTAIIYYSGHGHRHTSGETFLVPYDAGYPLHSSALSAQDFAGAIELIKPRRLLVVLDCCHAEAVDAKDAAGAKDTTGSGLTPAAITGDSPGIDALAKGDGRAVLSSSRGVQRSYIRTDGEMSVFTYHLIEALTGYAGRPAHPTVTVTEVMDYVGRHVPATARTQRGHDQEPVFRFNGTAFPVALVLGGKGIPAGMAPPGPLAPMPMSMPIPMPKVRATLEAKEAEGTITVADIEEMSAGEVEASAKVDTLRKDSDTTVVRIKKLTF